MSIEYWSDGTTSWLVVVVPSNVELILEKYRHMLDRYYMAEEVPFMGAYI